MPVKWLTELHEWRADIRRAKRFEDFDRAAGLACAIQTDLDIACPGRVSVFVVPADAPTKY